MLAFLWFLGHQTSSYRDVADRFGVTLSSLFAIITRVTDFFMLYGRSVIHLPTVAERRNSEQYFKDTYNFPGVIGNVFIR